MFAFLSFAKSQYCIGFLAGSIRAILFLLKTANDAWPGYPHRIA